MTLLTDARRALLEGLVDYAGIFPPASLEVAGAVAEYREARQGPHAWMLGRFLCPASHLEQLAGELTGSMTTGEAPWRVSVVFDGAAPADAISAAAFDRTMSPAATVELVEAKLPADADQDGIAVLLDAALSVSSEVVPFLEVGRGSGMPSTVDTIASLRRRRLRPVGAKLRTGGVTADAFPEPEEVATFIAACQDAGLPFKVTAGLHDPVRHRHPELDVMRHGFLNLLVTAALAGEGAAVADLTAAIADTDSEAFTVTTTGLSWRGRRIAAGSLLAMRHRLFPAYGSCSFDEPVAGLAAMGIVEGASR